MLSGIFLKWASEGFLGSAVVLVVVCATESWVRVASRTNNQVCRDKRSAEPFLLEVLANNAVFL